MALNLSPRAQLLRPLVGLAGWTFVMEVWLYSTRLPAMRKAQMDMRDRTREQLNAQIPRPVQWVAENYNHLHEQPTVFYAVTLALAVLGDASPLAVRSAWSYVALRVLHSLAQASTNNIRLRFPLFISSSAVLAGLTAKVASLVF